MNKDRAEKSKHIEMVHRSFEQQAEKFDTAQYHLSKKEYMDYLIQNVQGLPSDTVLELTDTPKEFQNQIIQLMEKDLRGEGQTGFFPYRKEGKIYFDHRWLLLIGVKR